MVAAGFRRPAWWKESVVYQIYPASFLDSNGDGWGDVNGITSKLDYLKELGVDVVWTSPIYKSPQADMGYDIADYKDIDHRYGSLEDVDRLIAELKKRDMRLVMDLVVNHTSNEHYWFTESRSSTTNPKRNWYHWQKPKGWKDGKPIPPNNWSMILGEANSAWTFDEKTQEFYLALFTPEQPDLNWECEEVREAVHDVLRFWLERGASGFRMDVINLISKVPGYPDAPVVDPGHEFQPGFKHYANGPHLHQYLKEMNRAVLSKYDCMTVGEMPFIRSNSEIMKAVGAQEEELNMIFIFELVDIDNVPNTYRMTLRDWEPKEIKECMNRWQRLMIDNDGWNSLFIENHDNPRSVSRYTDDSDATRDLGAKLIALMQTTLCGTLYVYQGEELGMRNAPPSWEPEEYLDIESQNYWKKMESKHAGDEKMLKHARSVLQVKARDHARTPVQWTPGPNAGFCAEGVKPWMRVNDDWKTCNAETERATPASSSHLSTWQFWQRGLKSRKDHKDVFIYGDFTLLDEKNDSIFAYTRESEHGEKWIVVLNFSKDEVKWTIPAHVKVEGWMAGNYTAGKPETKTSGGGEIVVRAWEGLLGKCA